jgi:hypothetical protein
MKYTGVNDWIGTFNIQKKCDPLSCCCPPNTLNITEDNSANSEFTMQPTGICASPSLANVAIPKADGNSANISGVGSFSVSNDQLDVLLPAVFK